MLACGPPFCDEMRNTILIVATSSNSQSEFGQYLGYSKPCAPEPLGVVRAALNVYEISPKREKSVGVGSLWIHGSNVILTAKVLTTEFSLRPTELDAE